MYTGSMFTVADNCVATADASKPPPEYFDSDGGCDIITLRMLLVRTLIVIVHHG